jgi:hypothetical protein
MKKIKEFKPVNALMQNNAKYWSIHITANCQHSLFLYRGQPKLVRIEICRSMRFPLFFWQWVKKWNASLSKIRLSIAALGHKFHFRGRSLKRDQHRSIVPLKTVLILPKSSLNKTIKIMDSSVTIHTVLMYCLHNLKELLQFCKQPFCWKRDHVLYVFALSLCEVIRT